MKKKLVASLAAAMVLGIAGTSFAANNPFVDLPAKHWAYESVTKLAQAGIVDGYGDGTFRGDRNMSRYEMAQIVAKAMARSDKADASQKAMIDKLSVEFANELEGLNVRVTKIEKNASSIKVTGEARIRFENINAGDTARFGNTYENIGVRMMDSQHHAHKTFAMDPSSNTLKLRTRVHLNGNISDDWTYYGRLQAENDLRGGGDNTVTMDNVWVRGPLLGATATIGRFDYYENDGLMLDSTLNGVNFAFGNVLKTNVFYGKDNNTNVFGLNNPNNLEVTGIAMSYGVSEKTNLTGGYYQFKDKNEGIQLGKYLWQDSVKVWEVGFNTKLNDDWALKASYGQSDADADDTAYYAQLGYKGADKSKVGSYGAFVNYRHLEANASPKATFDGAYTAYGQHYNDLWNPLGVGAKGYEIGFNYTPIKNAVLQVKYVDLKPINDTFRVCHTSYTIDKTKFFQAQAEFFF